MKDVISVDETDMMMPDYLSLGKDDEIEDFMYGKDGMPQLSAYVRKNIS